MSTKKCQEYLVEKFASWADDRYGPQNFTAESFGGPMDPAFKAEYAKIVKNAHKASGWKRLSKFTVGSKVDVEGTDQHRTGDNLAADYPKLRGWTCRIFLLKDSDSIEIALFEKDGEISSTYVDYSD